MTPQEREQRNVATLILGLSVLALLFMAGSVYTLLTQ